MKGREGKLAVLFADVSGSAKLFERLGNVEAERAVDRCVKRMERAIEGFGGRVVKASGDEFMVLFDSAEAACQSAQEMQQRVSDLPPVSGIQLAIRIGFHVGPVTEGGDGISGETVNNAARIVGVAQSGQIFTSLATIAELPAHLREATKDVGQSSAEGVQLFEVLWQKVDDTLPAGTKAKAAKPAATATQPLAAAATVLSGKLCLRYRGRAYLLDGTTPVLSMGRDTSSDVVIEDRKASRHHGRIEWREDKFFYLDKSTNGSYVALAGKPETMVRRAEIPLVGNGSICFGASGNDPAADCATFEYL